MPVLSCVPIGLKEETVVTERGIATRRTMHGLAGLSRAATDFHEAITVSTAVVLVTLVSGDAYLAGTMKRCVGGAFGLQRPKGPFLVEHS